jgi:hypothetical protein
MNSNVNNEKTRRRRIRKPVEYYESEEYKQKQAEYQRQQEVKITQMKLDSSMGTQTEVIPRPTYKELEKQPFIARITATLETNDHDGYCSDDDCVYTRKTVKANIVVPRNYDYSSVRKIQGKDLDNYKWANHLPLPDVNYGGSGYCKFVKPKGGVGQHEYRYTINMVEIVENPKYDESKLDWKPPIQTITAGQMIQALSKLPADAKLVITESGFYSNSEFSKMMLPEEYIVGSKGVTDERIRGLSKGAKVYRIGHSEQHY